MSDSPLLPPVTLTAQQHSQWETYYASLKKRAANNPELQSDYRQFAAFWRAKYSTEPDYRVFLVAWEMGMRNLADMF